jgi:hypothetical protein
MREIQKVSILVALSHNIHFSSWFLKFFFVLAIPQVGLEPDSISVQCYQLMLDITASIYSRFFFLMWFFSWLEDIYLEHLVHTDFLFPDNSAENCFSFPNFSANPFLCVMDPYWI